MRPPADRSLYLGLSDADREGRPWTRHFRDSMAPLPEHVRRALLLGPVAPPLLPGPEQVAALLEDGDLPVEDGFTRGPDGSLRVAVRTRLPGVRPEMIDWWFGWHGCEAQRYKLWHPRAHLHAGWGDAEPAGASGRDRYVGRTSYIDEYIGHELQHAAIRFVPPAEVGLDEGRLAAAGAIAVCGRIGMYNLPFEGGLLVHHVRPTADGAELRSRFWIGGSTISLQAGRAIDALVAPAARALAPQGLDFARDLLTHCSQEMSHLGGLLPELYAECGGLP